MAVFLAVRKDLGTGSITGASQQSYVIPYYIYTDNHESPKSMYEQARSGAGIKVFELVPGLPDEETRGSTGHVVLSDTGTTLPIYGTVDSTVYVSNINIERASENNLSSIPTYGLTAARLQAVSGVNSSYTCWLYTVTFTASDTTTITTAEAPWNRDTAISCSFSPKTYERYDNKTLIPNFTASKKDVNSVLNSETLDDTPVPNYPLYEEKYSNLYNTVGDDLYRNRTVYNYLLNFTYAVRRFDAEWLPLFMNTMNLKDCVICGIPIKKYHAAINELRVEQAEWNNKIYYNVSVEVEIQYQQRITYDEYVSSGYRAFMIEGSDTAITEYLNHLKSGLTKEKAGFVYRVTGSTNAKKYPVPIEELTDIRQRDKVPDNNWFMKKKNLGYFENLKDNNEEIVPNTKRIYLIDSSLGDDEILISYVKPEENSTDYDEIYYLMRKKSDTEYEYSTSQTSLSDAYLRIITVTGTGADAIYYRTKYMQKTSVYKKSKNPLEGQYNSIQSPLALNKFGGVYFSENESTTIDNVTEPGKIDMYDPMLGKVKDYQHVARDWTALGFPKKGMFWSSTADNNFEAMNKVSAYFK